MRKNITSIHANLKKYIIKIFSQEKTPPKLIKKITKRSPVFGDFFIEEINNIYKTMNKNTILKSLKNCIFGILDKIINFKNKNSILLKRDIDLYLLRVKTLTMNLFKVE